MLLRLTLAAALLTLAISVAIGADLARACSCAPTDPRDRLADGEPAVIGEVEARRTVESTPAGEVFEYTVRVERGLNASLGPVVMIRGASNGGACGFRWEVGQRVGAFLWREGGNWTTGLCSLVSPAALAAATKPYPRARGRGRVALLLGGSFAGARVMALDRAGRVLGYGFGPGSVGELSVCPGARRSAELVHAGAGTTRVAVRELRTLRVLRSLPAPRATTALRCADRSGRRLFAAGVHYPRANPRGRVRIARLTRGGPRRVAAAGGDTVALTGTRAYVAGRSAVLAVDLATGRSANLASYPDAGAIAPGPFGTRLAVSGVRHRTRVFALPGGDLLGEVAGGVPAWLPDGRLLVSGTGGTHIYGADLAPLRRLPRLPASPGAVLANRAYGVARRRLYALDLVSGRRRGVTLPDPDTFALAPVPGAPRIHAPRTAPSPAAAATAACGRRMASLRARPSRPLARG